MMTIHTQNVVFEYLDSINNAIFSIESKVGWNDDGKELSVNFFNPQTGYTNSSNPSATMNGWSYQDEIDNYEIWNLITNIQLWQDWTDNLSWEDDTIDTFTFTWDGTSYTNEVCHYNDDGKPTYYKELTLI